MARLVKAYPEILEKLFCFLMPMHLMMMEEFRG
eukprot:CAMPEP_0117754342 /NCGR_PEP_ID=MMETSP0947-20121206/12774_1 /TAXON_ID=44440 /ORGANISM="Chattonella subsalsa, Strain CCMP2191" /LENGTH=32 /DNA_ID= /DNA_START= /DNA_END= /DNA_ORIENTATION=